MNCACGDIVNQNGCHFQGEMMHCKCSRLAPHTLIRCKQISTPPQAVPDLDDFQRMMGCWRSSTNPQGMTQRMMGCSLQVLMQEFGGGGGCPLLCVQETETCPFPDYIPSCLHCSFYISTRHFPTALCQYMSLGVAGNRDMLLS